MAETPDAPDLGAALDAVTGSMARRVSTRLDRLMQHAADLLALEQEIAAQEAAIASHDPET